MRDLVELKGLGILTGAIACVVVVLLFIHNRLSELVAAVRALHP